ncbi:MAG: hypothetical protein LUE65_09640 [Clostridiales bacterium]|nr:hypothetical protein [Clostridiales bacterium]MCD8370269.1 hypothetical protein [Clostridiales bacterium]
MVYLSMYEAPVLRGSVRRLGDELLDEPGNGCALCAARLNWNPMYRSDDVS